MLTRARATLPRTVHLVAGDSEALPWPASSVDVIVSCSSFHYWADPEQALREVRRVLRPGGRLVITDWCSDYWVCRVFDAVLRLLDPTHSRIYGQARCRRLLDSAGLTDVEVESYRVPWPWGMMTATARAM
jgi:ubiquinone/menaquinone biosynthesis C-methylase UbiE